MNIHMTKKPAIIVDLDGTLATIGDRSPYDASRCDEDDLCTVVFDAMIGYAYRLQLRTNHKTRVILMTGRQECDRLPTERWLEKHNIQYDSLFMRTTKDGRPDFVIKRELYETHVEPYYEVHLVLDDRQQVVDMWREIGLRCFQVDARIA